MTASTDSSSVPAHDSKDDGRFCLGKILKDNLPPLKYALMLFIPSRIVLSVIGILSWYVISDKDISNYPDWFNIWSVWDSTWYVDIASEGYTTIMNDAGMAQYAFFPLYPFFIRLTSLFIGDTFMAGIIVSNICLIITCIYLYKLVKLDSDDATAYRSIKYLFLFPTAFILSGILTESLFIALSVASFYYAKKHNWFNAGIMGLLTSLTRPYGIIIVIPLAYEYLKSIGFKPGNIKLNSLYLLLVPLGLSIFSVYNYYLTGDFLAFLHIQSAWGHSVTNPIMELVDRLDFDSGMEVILGGYFTLISLAMLIVFYRKIDVSLCIYGLVLILIPLSTPVSHYGMLRYILGAFPLFIILAKLAENKCFDHAASFSMALLQGFLMVLWVEWCNYIV